MENIAKRVILWFRDFLERTQSVIKVKKIACKALKGRGVNSGLRLVYAYFKHQSTDSENDENKTEKEKIVFIELYHKSDKENVDKERILKHFK